MLLELNCKRGSQTNSQTHSNLTQVNLQLNKWIDWNWLWIELAIRAIQCCVSKMSIEEWPSFDSIDYHNIISSTE